ncbi:hypothetical protein HIM_02308 [Hirsutella minnesotensis 3608]|nr:hypothetical protein HIM_02308 [Hirsutella minnesotensis 3608]
MTPNPKSPRRQRKLSTSPFRRAESTQSKILTDLAPLPLLRQASRPLWGICPRCMTAERFGSSGGDAGVVWERTPGVHPEDAGGAAYNTHPRTSTLVQLFAFGVAFGEYSVTDRLAFIPASPRLPAASPDPDGATSAAQSAPAALNPRTLHLLPPDPRLLLDTTAGRPARGIRVRLEGADASFESLTDDDGRIAAWLPYSSATSSGEVPVYTLDDVLGALSGPSHWTLRFDVEGYFGDGNTFFPEAVVVFRVQQGQRYHVPLLLSPYSYTTYRGS